MFAEELKRLRTDYVDYYLMHMLTDTWNRLKTLGIEEWIARKKESVAIRQIGFSYHGNSEMFCNLVDAYDWDFCQIQYNYMDEHSQAGRRGLYHAHEKGIPAGISNSAGTYVCNHVMYVSLHQAAVRYPEMKAGFIHVPFLPEQISDRKDKERLVSMTLEDMVTAVQAVLETAANDLAAGPTDL